MSDEKQLCDPDGWARLRFAVIGPLLADPPPSGELGARLRALAAKDWRHPLTGLPVRFGFATLERWYYLARDAQDPVAALRRRRRSDAGVQRGLGPRLVEALQAQYRDHPGWTVQLHYDNLAALVQSDETLAPLPSYASVRRFMKRTGLHRRRVHPRRTPGAEQAARRLEACEVRSFEAKYVHALWHLDFHHGERLPAHPGRRLGHAAAAGDHRRSLPLDLPSAVVSGRNRRNAGARPRAGVAEARAAAGADERQRRGDAGRGIHRRTACPGHPA